MICHFNHELELREVLMKTETYKEFCVALYGYLLEKCPESNPINIDLVFEREHRPKYNDLLRNTLIQYQTAKVLFPKRDISFNSNASKFMILSLDSKFTLKNDRSNSTPDPKIERNIHRNINS